MARVTFIRRLDERRVRWLLGGFFLALVIPSVVLVAQAFSQLKWEAFRNAQLLAEDVATGIDALLRTGVAAEEARSFGDYSFLVVEGDAAANFVQRSPLSAFPVMSAIPGVIGYFQVDPGGTLTTPLLPDDGVDPGQYGVTAEEADARRALATRIHDVLAENRLVRRRGVEKTAARAPAAPSTSAELVTAGGRRDLASPNDVRQRSSADAAATTLELRPENLEAEAPAPTAAPLNGQVPAARLGLSRPPAVAAPTVQNTNAPAAKEAQEAFDLLAAPAAGTRRSSPAGAEGEALPKAQASAQAGALLKDEAAEANRETAVSERQKRTEQSVVPEPKREPTGSAPAKLEFRVRTFESELDPFELGLLDTGHLVIFRNVWHDGRRYIQGALIDRSRFVAEAIGQSYRASSLAQTAEVAVTYRGNRLLGLVGTGAKETRNLSASDELSGTLLHRARLSPPFSDVELAFNVQQLPRAPGTLLLGWVTVTLAAVLCVGFLLIYRFAIGQIRLTKQQQDFVSAVSHELKTPLTSIRMYGEMLKAGWADDEKKKLYYDYIHSESERLSRLIENVLQLARLTRSSQRFDLKRITVAELMDLVKSKLATQVERAGFVLSLVNEVSVETELVVDADCFTQIVINLVDNALKFSADAERKTVEIASRRESDGSLLFTVRDFGPGVPKNQMKRIFELFYRPANELTRETVGTGIGLALVHELATAMGGRVDVRNREPGAEFRLSFPAA